LRLIEEIWPGGGASARALIFLCCGLAVFAVAMSYDLTDPERVTHRSDCAFWLHFLAAPLLVHSLIELVAGGGVLVVVFLTIVALSIDAGRFSSPRSAILASSSVSPYQAQILLSG
jgi:hypothetical protein